MIRKPPTAKKQKPQAKCRQCYFRDKKRKDTVYICGECPDRPGLCSHNCFNEYHTRLDINVVVTPVARRTRAALRIRAAHQHPVARRIQDDPLPADVEPTQDAAASANVVDPPQATRASLRIRASQQPPEEPENLPASPPVLQCEPTCPPVVQHEPEGPPTCPLVVQPEPASSQPSTSAGETASMPSTSEVSASMPVSSFYKRKRSPTPTRISKRHKPAPKNKDGTYYIPELPSEDDESE